MAIDQVPIAEWTPRRLTMVATVAAVGGLVVMGYRFDRTYRRWLSEISPLVGPRASLERLRIGYRERRADVSDLALIMFVVLDEIAQARSRGTTR